MFKRPNVRFSMIAFSLFSVLVLLLSACGATGTPAPTGTGNGGTPVKGGTWIDDIPAGPGSLLSNGSDTTYSVVIDQALYAPLFYGDPQGHIHPGIVQDIPTVANGGASADLKTWTFKLRPGLKWSDGQPLTADDIAFSVKMYNDPKFGAKFTVPFSDIVSSKVSADKLSITFTLDKPIGPFVPPWVDANPGGLLPAHKFQSMAAGDILKSADSQLPTVVNGPFMIKPDATTAQQQYTLVRNPNYYLASQGYPYLDSVVFRVVDNPDTILKDVQSGAIDSSWFIDISKVDAYKAAQNYTVVPDAVSAGYEALWFDQNNPALKDVNVRKAIAMAIDQQKLITTARNGYAKPLCTDHPASVVPGYEANAPCPKYDPAAANALLDQAGWVKGSDGVRAKGGVRLDFKYTTTTLGWRKTDQLINQAQLSAIGIKTTLVNTPGSTFFGSVLPQGKPGTYDIGEFEQTYTYDADDSSTLNCANIPSAANSFGGQNYSFWCDKQADALFNQELGTTDPNVRQDAFNKLHQIYLTQFPFVTEYAPVDVSVAKNVTHNYLPGPMGAAETVNLWTWWCNGGKC